MPNQKLYLLNAIPANAIPLPSVLVVYPVDWERAREIVRQYAEKGLPIESYIGHHSTAALLAKELGIDVAVNRGEAKLNVGDRAIVVVLKRRVSGDVEVDKGDVALLHVRVAHVSACTEEP